MEYKLIELRKTSEDGNVALILRGTKYPEYAVVRNIDITKPMESDEQWDNTIEYYPVNNSLNALANAVDCLRRKTETQYISRTRLEEIATKEKDYISELLEDEIGYQEGVNYFRDELEMEDYELEFFGIEIDKEDDDYSSNMYCDNTGLCSGLECSNYVNCFDRNITEKKSEV